MLKGEHIWRWVGGADRQDADRQQHWGQPEQETPGRGETGLRASDHLGLRIWVRLDLAGADALAGDAPNRALAALPQGLSAVCSKPLSVIRLPAMTLPAGKRVAWIGPGR